MLDKLQEIYEEVTGDFDITLTPDMVIDEDLNLSSIGKIQLVYAIEEKFDLEIPSKAIRQFVKIENIIEFLKENAD